MPRVLVGNKCDLVDKLVVPQELINELRVKHSLKYFETSAKANIAVDAAYSYVVEKCYKQ